MCSQYLDTPNTILGNLNYSINQEINGSVVFKLNKPLKVINSETFTLLKLQLMENGEPIGEPAHFHKNGKSVVFSNKLNFLQTPSEINNLGVIATFEFWEGGQSARVYEKEYKIEFVNGEILQKEIIVE